MYELQQLQGESEPAPEPEESENVGLPPAVGSGGKSALKFLEPKEFSGSEDSRPIDVFLDSAERWLKYGAKEPPQAQQWAMFASSLLTGQAEQHFRWFLARVVSTLPT